jgi:Protein of unknown function (DUF2796)
MKVPGLALCLALVAHAAAAAPAHEHGAARLDVVVEGGRITLGLEAPLDNLLGFERAPRTDAERRQADAVVATLKAADALFGIDPAAGCRLASVELESATLKLGQAEPDAREGHADIDAGFAFDCANASRAGFIEVGLFKAFPRLRRLDVQVATGQAQLRRTLTPQASRLTLKR